MLEWLVVIFAVGLATSLVVAAAALLIAAALARPRGVPASELLRLYPDLVRLLASLSKDRRVGRAVRWRLLVALAYNADPAPARASGIIPTGRRQSGRQGRIVMS